MDKSWRPVASATPSSLDIRHKVNQNSGSSQGMYEKVSSEIRFVRFLDGTGRQALFVATRLYRHGR